MFFCDKEKFIKNNNKEVIVGYMTTILKHVDWERAKRSKISYFNSGMDALLDIIKNCSIEELYDISMKLDFAYIDWVHICTEEKLNEKFITIFKKELLYFDRANKLFENQKVPAKVIESYLKEHEDYIDTFTLDIIFKNQEMTDSLIYTILHDMSPYAYKYFDLWSYISTYGKISEKFIENNPVNWHYISTSQPISEEFIIRNKDNVHFKVIGTKQKLSHNFIHEFKEKLNWNTILTHQILSDDFILEHLSYVEGCKTTTLQHFLKHHSITDNLKFKLEDIVDLKLQEEKKAKIALEEQKVAKKAAKNRRKRQARNQRRAIAQKNTQINQLKREIYNISR